MNDISYQVLPQELQTLIKKGELDWSGGAYVTSLQCFDHGEALLGLELVLYKSERTEKNWQVKIKGLVQESIQRAWSGDNIIIYDQHFLIEEQQDEQTSLYIKNAPDDPNKVLSAWHHHFYRKFEDYLTFDQYTNPSYSTRALLKMPFGLFAQGPQFILEEIQYVLELNGVATYFQGEYQAAKWKKDYLEWGDVPNDLLLLSIGKSYFIAENFSFEKLPKKD